jgi:hypothetical protein
VQDILLTGSIQRRAFLLFGICRCATITEHGHAQGIFWTCAECTGVGGEEESLLDRIHAGQKVSLLVPFEIPAKSSSTSLRYGRPPNQDDDDMDVQLPGDEASNGTSMNATVNGGFANQFGAMCMLARIEGRVYKRLYSVQASRQSVQEMVNSVDQLDEELAHWRQSVPEEFRPESEIRVSEDVLRLQIVNFHLAYYHCLAAIHRKLVQHGHWVTRLDPLAEDADKEKIRQHVFSSAVLCVSAARASINLIRLIPQGNLAFIW